MEIWNKCKLVGLRDMYFVIKGNGFKNKKNLLKLFIIMFEKLWRIEEVLED